MGKASYHHITPRGELDTVRDLAAGKAALAAGGYLWLDVTGPSRETLDPLVDEFGIHPLSVDDCLDTAEVPKLDLYGGSTFLLFNCYAYSGGKLRVGEIDCILGRDFLVTVSGREGEALRLHERVEALVRSNAECAAKGPDHLLHLVLGQVVDEKARAIDALREEADALEDAILRNAAEFRLQRIVRQRRHLLDMRKSLFYEREVMVKICRRDSPLISEAAIYHFRDVYDHLTKYYEEVEILREMLLGLMEMYLSLVNNRMSMTANRTNDSVRRLTYISVIFLPLMFLSGVGGMSEYSMMTGVDNWRLTYPAFLGAMALIGAAMYFVVRWMDRGGAAEERAGE